MRHERPKSSSLLEPRFIIVWVVLIANLIFLTIYVIRVEQRFSRNAVPTFESDVLQSLTEIRRAIKVIEDGSPWEHFGEYITDIIDKESPKELNGDTYEYAVFRNGGFRTLTASTWNGGWRVMTSPHMTGDSGTFRLGGSMWIWGTKDKRDDEGVYHLYYYATTDGTIATTSGNGLTRDGKGGIGQIYRRRRQ